MYNVWHNLQLAQGGRDLVEVEDRATRTPLNSRDEHMCSGSISSFCSTSGIRRFFLVTNPVISHQ